MTGLGRRLRALGYGHVKMIKVNMRARDVMVIRNRLLDDPPRLGHLHPVEVRWQ